MPKLKMLPLPKKPKATASVAVKEKWLKRAADVKKQNEARKRENKKSEELTKKIVNYK